MPKIPFCLDRGRAGVKIRLHFDRIALGLNCHKRQGQGLKYDYILTRQDVVWILFPLRKRGFAELGFFWLDTFPCSTALKNDEKTLRIRI